MVNRTKFNDIINSMEKIALNHDECDMRASIQKIVSIREKFDIKLMFVGHFNAGKSSLLNALIGRPEFLEEAQIPQTAIATELSYNEKETAIAYNNNGEFENVVEGGNYTPDKYSHLEYQICEESLKAISDFTIVDTPGFDAGIEAHAKALSNYIGMGSGYVVVVDQEKGGIDQITLDFINEISRYSSQICVLINKCDKITDDIRDSIAEAAKFTLESYGLPYPVYTVSAREVNIAETLISIIQKFNAQDAFDKIMRKSLCSELINVKNILSITKEKLFLDTFDLDSEISAYNKAKEQLAYTFQKKREDAKNDLPSTVERIASEIRSALTIHADSVAEALLSGNKIAAEAIIVENIRPIMVASMKDVSIRQLDDVTAALDFSGLTDKKDGDAFCEVALNLAGNIKGLIEQGTFDSNDFRNLEKRDRNKNLYHTITGIAAIATNVIAPWLEVVIILLPDILSLLNGIFGESDLEVAKRRFVNNVIPQVMNKIYPEIKSNVESSTATILDEYERALTEKLDILKSSIIDAEKKKKEKTEHFATYKKTITDDVSWLDDIIKELR